MGKTFIFVEVTEKATLVKMNGKASELTALIACAVQTIANNGGKLFNGVMDNVMFTLEKIHKAETKGKLIEGIANGMNYIEDNLKGDILVMLSILVDTFYSRDSWTMLQAGENRSISVA